MRHNRRDDGQLSCRKREMKTMNANTALDGHTTVIKMAERGGVPLKACPRLQPNPGQNPSLYLTLFRAGRGGHCAHPPPPPPPGKLSKISQERLELQS